MKIGVEWMFAMCRKMTLGKDDTFFFTKIYIITTIISHGKGRTETHKIQDTDK